MKTLRKAFWGIFFLAPLFLPSQTQAGPFNGRPEFGNQRPTMGNPFDQDPYDHYRNTDFDRGPAFDRTSSFGDRRGQENDYRPYNPWADRHDPAGAPGAGADPGAPNSVPIDGGLVFLLVAGLGLGALRVYGLKKRTETAVA